MAFRIADSVVRGEIDNRVKGIVRGRVWLAGRAEPLQLELKGNAWPDLAGCLLQFTNPLEQVPHPSGELLETVQSGSIGDLTASRKVRVLDLPIEKALQKMDRGQPVPEHIANCLYLEWFSEANGRVVIESTDYALSISPPEWRLTPEEETERSQQAAVAMQEFMNRLTQKIELQQQGQKDPDEQWDEHDYEKFLKESDARTDKYMELLDKYGDSEEADDRIAKEMGWDQNPDEEDGEAMTVDEMNALFDTSAEEPEPEPDPSREGIDWIRTKDGHLVHPLQHRCMEGAIRVWRHTKELCLDRTADKDLDNFLFEFQTTSAKLAGALNGLARGRSFTEAAFTVACLKRALDHLHKAQAALEGLAPRQVLPEPVVAEARKELFEIREGILRLMDELRGRT